jgi:hypothetical protein
MDTHEESFGSLEEENQYYVDTELDNLYDLLMEVKEQVLESHKGDSILLTGQGIDHVHLIQGDQDMIMMLTLPDSNGVVLSVTDDSEKATALAIQNNMTDESRVVWKADLGGQIRPGYRHGAQIVEGDYPQGRDIASLVQPLYHARVKEMERVNLKPHLQNGIPEISEIIIPDESRGLGL